MEFDVTDRAAVHAALATLMGEGIEISVLVNNAGVAHSAPLSRITPEDWNRVLAVNATGTFLCTQAFIGGMLERYYAGQREALAANETKVAGLLAVGVVKPDPELDRLSLAAMTNVAALVMSSPDAYTVR